MVYARVEPRTARSKLENDVDTCSSVLLCQDPCGGVGFQPAVPHAVRNWVDEKAVDLFVCAKF